MTRRFLPLIALGCGAWLAFAVSLFPAATALRWFAPDTVRTSNVSGTIWSGSAELASVSGLPLRDLSWQIRLAPLLLARLTGTVETSLANGFANARFSISGDRIRLEDVQMSTSVSTFVSLLPIGGASGALSARLESIELDNQWPVSASGTISLSGLLIKPITLPGVSSELLSAGSFEIVLSPEGESGVGGTISDLGGPLEVEATLSLTQERRFLIEGRLRERASADQRLVQGLEFNTGPPGPDGWRILELTGSL